MTYRLALVTGATSGIGKKTCELLARKGMDLLLTGRNQEELQNLQSQLSQQVSVETVRVDLANPQERGKLISLIHERIPDMIINNAGFGLYGDALTYETKEQVDILEVNAKAVLEITLEGARALVSKEKKGVILNVSSAAGFQIFPIIAVYSASKAFVNSFSQAFDFEMRRHGVRILTICPGMVETNFQRRAGSINGKQLGAMSAEFVAEEIWKQIQKLDSLTIIDWKYRFLTFLSYFVPKSWIAAVEERQMSQRISSRTFIKIAK